MANRPNVLLLIFDTLRADFISTFGGETETKAIESVANRGTRFEQAFAAAPITTSSHGAMVTGQYPSESGAVGVIPDIDDNIPRLPRTLRNAGYETFGIAGPARMGYLLDDAGGFDDTFKPYSEDMPDRPSIDYVKRMLTDSQLRRPLATELLSTALDGPDMLTRFKFELLKSKLSSTVESPFFGLVNVETAHMPYDPPRPYKEQCWPNVDRPRWFFLEYLLDQEETLAEDGVRAEHVYNAQTRDGVARFLSDPSYLNERELDVLRAWYRAEIRYLDAQLSRFLEWFGAEGYDEDTILILTSDHGEHFGEHGCLTHGHYLFEETLHVPLVIAGPGVPEGERRTDLVSLVDLFQTVCDLVDVPCPDSVSGQSMFGPNRRDAVFAEKGMTYTEHAGHGKYMSPAAFRTFRAARKCMFDEEYHIIVDELGNVELYDRDGNSVSDPDGEIVDRLTASLFEELPETFPRIEDEDITDENVRENLRDLGYIE